MPLAAINQINASSLAADSSESRSPQKTLGQEDFLKILVAQFTNQDPLNPKADTDYISQMATFSNLEMTKSMSNDFSLLRASSMLGTEVLVQPEPKSLTDLADPVTGIVSEVRTVAGKPMLLVNGAQYSLQQVLSVTHPVPPATPTNRERVPMQAVNN